MDKELELSLNRQKQEFESLFEILKSKLTDSQLVDLQEYLQAHSSIIDCNYHIKKVQDEELMKNNRPIVRMIEKRVETTLSSILNEDDIFKVLYLYSMWIIDGKCAW